jgi:hypothetical protein
MCLLAMASTTAAFAPARIATIHKVAQSPFATNGKSSIQPTSTCFPNALMLESKNKNTHNHQRKMTRMNLAAATGAATMMGIVSGGILGGALHAIAGELFS